MPRSANVLLICVDHWPASLLRAAGHSHILSPTLDQLAGNGVRFSRAYSTTPICIPARRALMTGTTARTHGDRVFREHEPMPADLPTMPAVFRAAGYQAHAVGKLHVYPQRDRIGFEDVVLFEEGRRHLGNVVDDYELHLRDAGYAGQELTHAMGNNGYTVRPWHLPEELHPTSWTVREMSRVIQRRDPTRPAFWYCSFAAPHPPVVPPAAYLDMYDDAELPLPAVAEWAARFEDWPYALRARYHGNLQMSDREIRQALRGFYAQCTYIDHQIRLLIGVLREEGDLDNTVLMFTSDHGDMLGQHRLWGKPPLYDGAAAVPLILVPTADDQRVGHHRIDDRLACLRDVMPTLLDLCGIDCPATVEGQSLVADARRSSLYAEVFDGDPAIRMLRDDRHKLVWYPVGNRVQLFDLEHDPAELDDLAGEPGHSDVQERLTAELVAHLYGSDLEWTRDGQLIGEPDRAFEIPPNRGLSAQRGWR